MVFDFFKQIKYIGKDNVEIKQAGIVKQSLGLTMPAKRLQEDYRQVIQFNFNEMSMREFYVDFKPQLLCKFSGDKNRIARFLEGSLNKIIGDSGLKVLLINETSDLGHWHYHGIIDGIKDTVLDKGKKDILFKIKVFLHGIGRHRIKYIRNSVDYINYMTKSIPKDEYRIEEDLDIFINLK